MTKEEILALSGAKDIVAKNGIAALIYPYNPYITDKNHIELDSYYVACNKAYDLAKKANIGTANNNIDIKNMLADCGLKKSFSSLIVHPKFGTYFLVQAINCNFQIDDIILDTDDLICDKCNKCSTYCPGKAISKTGFIRENCVRNMMDHPLTNETYLFLGHSLLGCRICRDVCPYNKNIKAVEMPLELKDVLNIENLLTYNAKTKEILTKYIGKNMARASVLLPQAIAIAVRNNRYDLYPLIRDLQNHPSDRVSQSAMNAIRIIETKSN